MDLTQITTEIKRAEAAMKSQEQAQAVTATSS